MSEPLIIRDEKGRWMPGSQGAKGVCKPHASRVATLRRAFVEAITPQDMQDVTANVLRIAKGGRPKDALAAAELLWERLFGRPKESIDLDVTGAAAAHLSPQLLPPETLAQIVDLLDRAQPQPTLPHSVITLDPVKIDVPPENESVQYAPSSDPAAIQLRHDS